MKKLGLLDAWESLTALTLHNRPFNYTEEQSVFTVETMQKVNCNCKWVLMPPVVLAANVIMLHQSVAHVVCVARCLPTHVSPAKKKLKKGKLTCTVRTSQTATCFNWCCNLPPLLYKLPDSTELHQSSDGTTGRRYFAKVLLEFKSFVILCQRLFSSIFSNSHWLGSGFWNYSKTGSVHQVKFLGTRQQITWPGNLHLHVFLLIFHTLKATISQAGLMISNTWFSC